MTKIELATCPECGCKYVNIKEEIKICLACNLKNKTSNETNIS